MSKKRLESAQGFIKNKETGVIYPVFERQTISDIEIDNLTNKKLHRNHLIKLEVVDKSAYEKYMADKNPVKKVSRKQEK